MKNNADEIDIGFDDKDKLLQDMFDKKEDIIRIDTFNICIKKVKK